MKIEQLTLENFKCFKSEKTFDFSRLTILTGANSSGKSSVINCALMALQSEEFPFSLSPNGVFINLGDFTEIINAHNILNKLKIGFTLKLRDNDTGRIVSNIISQIFTSWIQDEVSYLPKLHSYSYELKSYVDDSHGQDVKECVLIDEKNYNKEEYLNYTIKKLENFASYSTNYISAFRQSPQRTYLEKSKGDFKIGTEGEGYLDQIVEWEKRSNEKLNELVKVMKDLKLVEDIKTKRLSGGRFEVLVKPTNSSVLTALSNVGFGISQFLPIIVADLQLPDDSTLFLAEPEIHLHPSVQSKFGEYIVNQINNTDKNYVIETHSEYFLNRIRLAIVKGELKKEDVKVYFLENKNDDTDVYDIDFTKTGAIKNAPKNFFETYFADSMAITLNAVE